MIYPRLERVSNGQQMSVELINGIIKRTEYAADLLKKYRCLAGAEILVAQQSNGTRISHEDIPTAEKSIVEKLIGNELPYTEYASYPGNNYTPSIIFERIDFENLYGGNRLLAITLNAWGLNIWPEGGPQAIFSVFSPGPEGPPFTGYILINRLPVRFYISLPYFVWPATSGPTFEIVDTRPFIL